MSKSKDLYLAWNDAYLALIDSVTRPGHLIQREQDAWDTLVDYINEHHDVDNCTCGACHYYRRVTTS